MRPTIGMIVVYHRRSGPDCPAMITGVIDGLVALHVFPPDQSTFSDMAVVQDEGPNPKPGTWHWPKREDGPQQIGIAGT